MSDTKIYRTGLRGMLALANKLAKAGDKDEALKMAAADDDLESVQRLLREGAHINARKGAYETTALMEAAVQGNVDVMRFLVENGADINLVDKDGWTALMGATVEGRLESVELLLELGAQVNAENNKGQTALVMATGAKHTKIREALLRYGAEK